MLTWSASYPKSGNTWVRAFLAAYQHYAPERMTFDLKWIPSCSASDSRLALFADAVGKSVVELTDAQIDAHRGEVQRKLAATIDPNKVVKTHNARVLHGGVPLIHREVTAKAVYIVRNPLDVVDSLADHAGLGIDAAIKLLGNRRHQLSRSAGNVSQYLDSWSGHVKSWVAHQAFPVLLLRYEDLQLNAEAEFTRLIEFLNWKLDPARLTWAIEQTSFQAMKRLEAENGFAELSRVSKSGTFFRRGTHQSWQSLLTRGQAEQIIGEHRESMRIAGYDLPDLDAVYGESSASRSIDNRSLPGVAAKPSRPTALSGTAKREKPALARKTVATHPFVPPQWKQWIAQNLLRGGDKDELVRILVENGYSETLSRLEVDVADSHPYVLAARELMGSNG